MRLFSSVLTLSMVATALSGTAAFAKPKTDTEKRWDEFQRDPKTFMNKMPPKKSHRGGPVTTPFSKADVASKNFVLKKSALGFQGKAKKKSGFAEWTPDDLTIEQFVDAKELASRGAPVLYKLSDMESVRHSKLDETPWSDTYWPIAQGVIGSRYSSMDLWSRGYDWKSQFDYVETKSLKSVYDSQDAAAIDSLSPSEKYDLLIGDVNGDSNLGGKVYANGFLTPSMWKQGKSFYDSTGNVETWMGICHGWAPAAFMVPRPRNSVTVKANDGKTDLKFYPSDLKGLSSYVWSMNTVPSLFMGQRCNLKSPAEDPETGRIVDQACWDTNPANWHLAIVNRIAQQRKSFVMDATFDYEVWNQPVYGYSYTYFNPQTGQETQSMDEAKVAMADFTNDKFKKFRSPKAVSSVGIAMTVAYVSETMPNHSDTDAASSDHTVNVYYMYDLELDAEGKIIGGEWYYNKHPDFLWAPIAGGRAMSRGDRALPAGAAGSWQPGQELPAMWKDIAKQTAIYYGQPLAVIIDALVAESHKDRPRIEPVVVAPVPLPPAPAAAAGAPEAAPVAAASPTPTPSVDPSPTPAP